MPYLYNNIFLFSPYYLVRHHRLSSVQRKEVIDHGNETEGLSTIARL